MKKIIKRKDKFRSKKYLLLLAGLIAVSLFYISFQYVFNNLQINQVECVSQFGECSLAIKEKLEEVKNKPFKTVKETTVKTLEELPFVESFSIMYRFPDTLVINIIEEKVVFAIKKSDENLFTQLNKDGRAIKYASENALPFLEVGGLLPEIGNLVDEKTLFSLKILAEITKSYKVAGQRLLSDGMSVKIDNLEIIFPGEGDIEIVLGSFYTVYNQLNNESLGLIIGEAQPVLIDFRYQNPVIKFQ